MNNSEYQQASKRTDKIDEAFWQLETRGTRLRKLVDLLAPPYILDMQKESLTQAIARADSLSKSALATARSELSG